MQLHFKTFFFSFYLCLPFKTKRKLFLEIVQMVKRDSISPVLNFTSFQKQSSSVLGVIVHKHPKVFW